MNRACGTCQFFLRHKSSTFGTCSHPRHITFGVVPYVRDGETQCRRGFGDDDWTPVHAMRAGHATAVLEDRCIGEFPAPLGPRHRPLQIPSARVAAAESVPASALTLAD